MIGIAGACTLYQAWWILPFTPLAPHEVEPAASDAAPRLRLLISNVLMSNRNAAALLKMVRTHAPHMTVRSTAPPCTTSVIARLMKLLTRRGVLVEDMGQTYLAEPDTDGEEARTAAGAAGGDAHVSHRQRLSAPGTRC